MINQARNVASDGHQRADILFVQEAEQGTLDDIITVRDSL